MMGDCPVCEKGKLTQYSVCNGCGSEIADAEQMRFNILKYTEKELQEHLQKQRNQLLDDIKADFLAGIDNDTPEDMVIAIKACCVDLWKYRVDA